MRISFEMSGGVGGLFVTAPLTYVVDTNGLPDEQAATLRRLVDESGLLLAGHEAPAARRSQARDVLDYRLEISTGGRVHRFGFDDTTVPARARRLLEHLTAAAVDSRLGGPPDV